MAPEPITCSILGSLNYWKEKEEGRKAASKGKQINYLDEALL
jgi:hypothetical protein